MAVAQTLDKPERWDLPFSRDLPNLLEQRDMTDREVEDLLSVEPFSAMDPASFPKKLPLEGILRNDTRIRDYRSGDVVVRQGDYGNSAFLILHGSVRVILEGLDSKLVGRAEHEGKSWFRSIKQILTRPKSSEVRDARKYPQSQVQLEDAPAEGERVFIQDVTNVLEVFPDAFEKTKNAVMSKGELFGELAALGRIPRTATVVADEDATLLEIRWQGLRELTKHDEAMKKHVDSQFRQFGPASTLRATALLAHLGDEDAAKVAKTAQFETIGSFDWFGTFKQLRKKDADPLANEPLIAEEGHYPNGLIIIRSGFARLSRKHGNGEHTFGYLGKGDIYGLAELAHNARRSDQVALQSTLRAVGYVDIVRIPTRIFEQVILPGIPSHMLPSPRPAETEADTEEPATSRSTKRSSKINPALMESLVEHRFINGTKTMMIDLDRCTRCDECTHACASGHDNNPRFVRHGTILGHHMIANACMHCADPVCMIGCPTGAIARNEGAGEVEINDITCIGCGVCAASCPYDNIRLVNVRDQTNADAVMVDPVKGSPIIKATKCDLCVDHHGGPACERACPHDALRRVDMHELEKQAKWLNRS